VAKVNTREVIPIPKEAVKVFDPNEKGPVDCPKCQVRMNSLDIEVKWRTVTVDACPKCNGLWLDKGELKEIIGDRKLTEYLTKDIGTKTESPLVCPRCGGLMDYQHAEDVEVDVCLSCRGVWLDAGELAELEDVSKGGFEGDPYYKAAEKLEEMEADKSRTLLERFKRKLDL
jgi:Zn-finger nucleic acid-binding protein